VDFWTSVRPCSVAKAKWALAVVAAVAVAARNVFIGLADEFVTGSSDATRIADLAKISTVRPDAN